MRLIGAVRGICSLWLSGVEFNITAMMGTVMIIGIATAMGHLVSEFQALARNMPPHEALREAALNRVRPIVMSTLAMTIAMLPLGAAISPELNDDAFVRANLHRWLSPSPRRIFAHLRN